VIAAGLCVFAFLACLWAGRRSLGLGVCVLLVFGYFYGIVRANLLTAYSHFIFDAGLIGFYLSQRWTVKRLVEDPRTRALGWWTLALIAWPMLMVFMPFQPLLVSLVGLRGNALFLPLLVLGSWLYGKDVYRISIGLALLNLVALAFAGAEYFRGVAEFYPYSPVTGIVYSSSDVAGGFYRIPAIFATAHAYGGTMVASLPYLIGAWEYPRSKWARLLVILGIVAALLGVLMSATRLNFVTGAAIILSTLLSGKMKATRWILLLLVVAGMGWAAISNERLQRFKSLSDTDFITDRLAGSVNRNFFEILMDYPMGNGLGGGGTSIPYFLEGQVRNPVGMENEYARILSEQGIIGLLAWLSFIVWYIGRAKIAFARGEWTSGRRVVWCLSVFGLSTAWIGTGFLTAIPGTAILLLGMGWTAVPMREEAAEPRLAPAGRRVIDLRRTRHVEAL